jgi:DCN1-like protein 1/2
VGGAKQLPLEDVKYLAANLMGPRPGRFPWAGKWAAFLASRDAKTLVTRDAWALLPDLAVKVLPDLSNFEEDSAWPLLFDEFVAWCKKEGSGGGGGGGGGAA